MLQCVHAYDDDLITYEGAFGKVYKGELLYPRNGSDTRSTKTAVAIKTIKSELWWTHSYHTGCTPLPMESSAIASYICRHANRARLHVVHGWLRS